MAKRAFSRAFDAIPTTGLEQVTVRGSLVGTEHAARSQNLARDIVARVGPQNVKSITYNRSLSTTFSGVTDMRRPDVIVELKNGDVILVRFTDINSWVKTLLRVLALYDWPGSFDLSKHPEVLVSWVENARLTPNKASFFVPDEKKERRRTIFKNSDLIDVVSPFTNYTWMSLDEISGGNYLNLRSHLSYEPDEDSRRYVLARIAQELPVSGAVDHLHHICGYLSPRYGFSHVGEGASAIFATSGIASTGLSHDAQTRIGDLGDSLRRTKQHLSGKLHDVYELNVLSLLHLESRVRGEALGSWIKSGHRGELVKIGDDVFAWTVPENIRADLRWVLFKEGLLIATV